MSQAAIFWDRDDTLTRDPGYLSDPSQLELLPGAAEALKAASDAGFHNILVTNQSGIARGKFTEEDLGRIHDRLRELLAAQGAKLNAIYYCPYLDGDEATVEAYRQDSDLRKPKPGMLIQASMEHQVDLAASWSVGNSLRDAQAGRAAGCRTILIHANRLEHAKWKNQRDVDFVVSSLDEAVAIVNKHGRAEASRSGGDVSRQTAGDSELPVATQLQEILNFLRAVDRRNQAEEFSLTRLIGAIVQIVALGALAWSVFGLIHYTEGIHPQYRLLLGIQLQLVALTLFVISLKKT